MDSFISQIPNWAMGGFSAGGGFFAVKWFVESIIGRVDKREASVEVGRAQVDAAIQTLIAHLQQQIADLTATNTTTNHRLDAVEAELEHCREERAADREELARLRGANMGLGGARQEVAKIVAADRVIDRAVAKIVHAAGDKE